MLSFNNMVTSRHIRSDCGGGTTIVLLVSNTPNYSALYLPTTALAAFQSFDVFQSSDGAVPQTACSSEQPT